MGNSADAMHSRRRDDRGCGQPAVATIVGSRRLPSDSAALTVRLPRGASQRSGFERCDTPSASVISGVAITHHHRVPGSPVRLSGLRSRRCLESWTGRHGERGRRKLAGGMNPSDITTRLAIERRARYRRISREDSHAGLLAALVRQGEDAAHRETECWHANLPRRDAWMPRRPAP